MWLILSIILTVLFSTTVVVLVRRNKTVKSSTRKKITPELSNAEYKMEINNYFIYPEGYEVSLQSTLGHHNKYIKVINTVKDDVYEMIVNDNYIGYIDDGSYYVTTSDKGFDKFRKLKVKISNIKDTYYMQSIDDDRYVVYEADVDSYFLKTINSIRNPEQYMSKNFNFERKKRESS